MESNVGKINHSDVVILDKFEGPFHKLGRFTSEVEEGVQFFIWFYECKIEKMFCEFYFFLIAWQNFLLNYDI